MTVYTIGHSTRGQAELLEILKSWGVTCLVDIRSFPGSRKFPHFNRETLSGALGGLGIKYIHYKPLGGLRKKTTPDSPNTAWENESFRAYADYMQTPEFEKGLTELIRMATESKTVIMCAEAVPWRCHRQLISDALVALKGVNVLHILSSNKVQPHTMTRFAKVEGQRLTYPGKPVATKSDALSQPEAAPAAEPSPEPAAAPEPALASDHEPVPDPAPAANSTEASETDPRTSLDTNPDTADEPK
jgi:uncharacterized protein (DUF488 family)